MSSFIEDEEQPDDLVRYTCDICNRRFSDAALSKHRVICLKNAQRKRKVFDSRLQRARGLQMPKTKTDSAAILRERELKLAQIQERKSNWRMKHEEFISAIRAAKEYTFAKRSGGPLPPPPPSTIDPDLIQCKFCLRRFNEKAAERHIRFCEEKHKQMPKNPSKRSRNPTYSHSKNIPASPGEPMVGRDVLKNPSSGNTRCVSFTRHGTTKQHGVKLPVDNSFGRLQTVTPYSPKQLQHEQIRDERTPQNVSAGELYMLSELQRKSTRPSVWNRPPKRVSSPSTSAHEPCTAEVTSSAIGQLKAHHPTLSRQNGLALRSGRTHEDYLNAKELARDLVGECVRLPTGQRHPIGTAQVTPVGLQKFIAAGGNRKHNDEGFKYTGLGEKTSSRNPSEATVPLRSDGHEPKLPQDGDSLFDETVSDDPTGCTRRTCRRPGNTADRINGTVDKYRTKEVCGRSDGKVNKFCLECGSPFPNATAKFCPECGLRRMAV
ncbi:unnamed protein product [Dicrocoelium dendriticum]|nr:unnamed protein product [Dicrocoelium dendriticum]